MKANSSDTGLSVHVVIELVGLSLHRCRMLTVFIVMSFLVHPPSAVGQSNRALPGGLMYLHPRPGAVYVSPATTLAYRFGGYRGQALLRLATTISVRGSIGGAYHCSSELSDDEVTLILKPPTAFAAGETVTVVLRSMPVGSDENGAYSFEVASASGFENRFAAVSAESDPCLPSHADRPYERESGGTPDYRTYAGYSPVPSDYPSLRVHTSTQPSAGNIFINNWGGTPYLMIVENNGQPVFYRRMPARARDFKVQPTGMLTYRLGSPFDRFYGMDSTYAVVDTFTAGHGYGTDEHELQMLPNGHVLLIALDYRTVDMSAVISGGRSDALVIGNHIQELDTRGNVVFEWRSWDHFNITDAVHVDLTANVIDYVHMNAISVDADSNIVVSCRHLSEVTKINRTTGEIMWRLGGKNNLFNLSNPQSVFSWQHDGRALGNNHYTVFNNGNWDSPPETRVLEFELDTANAVANLVWQYRHSPPFYTWWMGNAQRLDNGNTLVGWADQSLPKLTEVTPQGETVLELDFVSPAHCYRVFKFPWEGKAVAPYLTAEATPSGVSLLFPVFGDTSIQQYYVYEGTSPSPGHIIDSSSIPFLNVTSLSPGTHFLRVAAADGQGSMSQFSNEEKVQVRDMRPGANLVLNGSFSAGAAEWAMGVYETAIAQSFVSDADEYFITITNGGPQIWSVQLVQGNIPLFNGKKYVFSFDARAATTRTVDAKLEMDGGTYANYSKSSAFLVTTTKTRFTVPFTMDAPTDYKARVVFNCGQSNTALFFDSVSVVEVVPSGVGDGRGEVPSTIQLFPAYPNPFNPATAIQYTVAAPSAVEGQVAGKRARLAVYDLLGREIAVLLDEEQQAGTYTQRWDASSAPSGTYVIQLSVGGVRVTQKLLLIR